MATEELRAGFFGITFAGVTEEDKDNDNREGFSEEVAAPNKENQ